KATWDSRPEPSQLPIGVREDPDLVGIPSGSESSQIPTRSGLLTGGSLGDVPEGVTSGLSGPPVWPVRAQKAGFRGTRRQDGRAVTGPAAHAFREDWSAPPGVPHTAGDSDRWPQPARAAGSPRFCPRALPP